MNKKTKEATKDVVEMLGWMVIGTVLLLLFWAAAAHASPTPRPPACECNYNFTDGSTVQVIPEVSCPAAVLNCPEPSCPEPNVNLTCPPVSPTVDIPLRAHCKKCYAVGDRVLTCRGCDLKAVQAE